MMNPFMASWAEKKIARTMAALRRNRMGAYFVSSREGVPDKVRELLRDGDSVAYGGSVTLQECGVMGLLAGGRYRFLDRDAPGMSDAERENLYRDVLFCDHFLMSANAVTENGELYNVDGIGTRLSFLIYGPKQVIVVAGVNKIVPDLDAAAARVKDIAAPVNAMRLERKTPCVKCGRCEDCSSPDRICCSTVISAYQRIPDRVQVILAGEPLGF